MEDHRSTHDLVKKAYGEVVGKQACCGPSSCCDSPCSVPDHPVPEADLGLSCGNPVAFSHLRAGDVVLDLGSGAGRDVFLAAQRVGATGRVIGVDMTPEMIALARQNAEKFQAATGLANVEFREGTIENLPVDGDSVDVVISNCVINLSPDKLRVFQEVFRVLRAGGRMIVSDIVLNRQLPPGIKDDKEMYAACIAGALQRDDYLKAIADAGFEEVDRLSDQTYQACQATGDPITGESRDVLEGLAASITVLARKGSS